MLFTLSVKLGGGDYPLRQTCRIPRYEATKAPRLIVLVTRASRMSLQNKKKTIPSPAQEEEDRFAQDVRQSGDRAARRVHQKV